MYTHCFLKSPEDFEKIVTRVREKRRIACKMRIGSFILGRQIDMLGFNILEKKTKVLDSKLNQEKGKNPELHYSTRNYASNEIPIQRQNILANKCFEIAKAANFGVSLEDVKSHLFDGNYDISPLKIEDKLQGFAIFDHLKIENKDILFLHGIVLHPDAQGKGLAKMLIIENIKKSKPDFLALRTHNPSMYITASSLSQNPDFVYPNFKKEVPEDIVQLAQKISYFKNLEGEICDQNLKIRAAYPQHMIQQFLRPKDEHSVRINASFSKGSLGSFDAQAILVRLR